MTNQKLKDTIIEQAVQIAELKEDLRLEEFLRKHYSNDVDELKKEVEGLKESGKCADTLIAIYEKENDDLKAKISELQAQGAEPFEEVKSE